MPSCAVINFSSGSWYPRGQQRLRNSLSRVGFEGAFLGFDDVARLGCPPHQQVPYGFKPYMFNEAAKFGFELVLWCDASVWAVRPVDSLFRQLQHEGHVFFENTITGQWASDASLRYFGVSRDIAFTIPMLHGLCMGLDLRHPRSQKFLKLWTESLPTFPGAWTNERQQVSRDPRVAGHRHDQTAASILAWQLEMPFISGPKTFLWHPSRHIQGAELDPAEPHHDICFYAQGM